jgi:hypothetical protein
VAPHTFGTKATHDLVLVASVLLGQPAQAASIPEPRRTRSASGSSIPSAPKASHPRFRHRRPALFGWAVPAHKSPHNLSSISVSVKSPLQSFPRLAEAAREPKPTTRPDVEKASEGHFPQHPSMYQIPMVDSNIYILDQLADPVPSVSCVFRQKAFRLQGTAATHNEDQPQLMGMHGR